MKGINLITISVSLVITLLFFGPVACANENKSFTCGVILPLTGSFGPLGTEVMQGVSCAAEEINMEGGADGYHINLEIADDTSDPDLAASLFSDMKKRGIPVVIGSLTTPLTLQMAQQISDKPINTVLISPRANGNDLYGISPGFYQIHSPTFHLGEVVADWLSYTADRAALVYIDDAYGLSFVDSIEKRLKELSRTVISAKVPIPHDDPQFTHEIQQILDNVSDTIVIIGCDAESVPFLKALSDAGFNGQVVLTESCLVYTMREDTGNITPETFSLFTANAYATLVPGLTSDLFYENYQKKYGISPEGSIAGYGYDTLMVIREALLHERQTGNITASSLMKGLEKVRYYGITGPKIFDHKNAVSPAYDRYIHRNGSFEILSTSIR